MENNSLRFIYFNLTNHCNLKCFYCYDESQRTKKIETLSDEVILNLAEDCNKMKMDYITLTGGEPLLRKEWERIARVFINNGVRVSISTNGLLLTNKTIEIMKKLNISLQVSLDGGNETMKFVSGVPNIFSILIKKFSYMNKLKVNYMVNTVIGKHNIDSMDEFIETMYLLKARTRFNFYESTLNDKSKDLELNIVEKYNLIMKINNFNKKKDTDLFFMTLPPLMVPENMPIYLQPGCGWAYNTAAVLSNGDVTICAPASGVEELIAGNIKTNSFYSIWNNSTLFTKLRQNTEHTLEGICKTCVLKGECLGGCRLAPYLINGNFNGPQPLCQEFHEAVLAKKIETDFFPIGCVKVIRDKNNEANS